MKRHYFSLRFDKKRERYVLVSHGCSFGEPKTIEGKCRRISRIIDSSAVASWPAKRGARDFTQRDAMRAAGRLLQALADDLGQRSELFVFGLDGRIVERNTYPRKSDPKASRG